MVARDVLCSELGLGVHFRVANTSVLKWGEDGGWYIHVVHLLGAASEESLGQEHTSLDGDWSELKLAIEDITDTVYVWHIGLLAVIDLELAVLLGHDSGSLKVESCCDSVSADGEEDGIILSGFLLTLLQVGYLDGAVRIGPLELGWDSLADELGIVVLHVRSDLLSNILVKTSEEDGPDHDCGIIAKSREEAGALEGDVGGTYDESPSWCLLQAEHIVTGETEFFVAWDAWVVGPTADCNHDLVSGDLLNLALAVVELDRMGIDKRGVRVVVFDLELHQISFVAPVQSLDVHLHSTDHCLPAEGCLQVWSPATLLLIDSGFREKCGVVHHLLGDAADVDAGTTEAPTTASWTWLDEVSKGHLLTSLSSVSCCRDSSRTTTNDEQVVLICVLVL